MNHAAPDQPALKVQLNYIDSYQSQPTRLDSHVFVNGATKKFLPTVPVVRVFGRTGDGQSVLAHVHGVFPYLYIKYEDDSANCKLGYNVSLLTRVGEEYIDDLYYKLNRAMAVALKRDVDDPRNVFVANIVLCKGVPFYGFHVGLELFLKVYLLNPNHVLKLADLLRNGATGAEAQPYEAHIPHIPQFFADFNLYGCNWMDLGNVYVRTSQGSDVLGKSYGKTSRCEVEVDVTADLILNRYAIEQQLYNTSFEAGVRPADVTQLTHLKDLFREDNERRVKLGVDQFQPPRSSQREAEVEWYRLGELKHRFDKLVKNDGTGQWNFDDLPHVPTVFESVNVMLKPKSIERSEPVQMGYEEVHQPDSEPEVELDPEPDQELEQEREEYELESGPVIPRPAKRLKTQNSLMSFIDVSRTESKESKSFGTTSEASLRMLMSKFGGNAAFKAAPPSHKHVVNTMEKYGPFIDYQPPFYSDEQDVRGMTHAGLEFNIVSDTVRYLPDFWVPPVDAEPGKGVKVLQYAKPPPKISQVQAPTPKPQPESPTPLAKNSQRNYMNVLSVEVYADSKPGKLPNPQTDQIRAIFWRILYDEMFDEDSPKGVLVWGDNTFLRRFELTCKWPYTQKHTEYDIIQSLVQLVWYYDPDILSGYDIQKDSWGFVIDRASVFGMDFVSMLSRTLSAGQSVRGDKWGLTHTTDINVVGRHMLNIWRVVRKELALTQYTLENVVWACLKERTPHFSPETLTNWFRGTGTQLAQVLKYFTSRLDYDMKIIEKQELVGRYSEQARVLGIDYKSVFYRGSQFQVESFLSRLTKKENFVMVSPSKKQVGEQNALEFIPLVMEPESQFYTSPVLVLDFQSLYPSIMIAYNYCYSTCLGRVVPWNGRNKIGFTDLELPEGLLSKLQNDITIAPNGIMYTNASVRRGVLATMLTELLDTRVMVKDGMKLMQDDVAFQKSMNNRQLALKLLANVTYGYTSASFSGRMPCGEIADSIVLSGREILESAIKEIQDTEKWGANVVYGDTDSLFVHLPGKSRSQAFDIGEDIARTITKQNPEPIKLKFEKVYHPCILQTKKRYVGYKYEHRAQLVPEFDAKGTETVRRDSTPIVGKVEEEALRIIFETHDLSKVKQFLTHEWTKIMRGDVSIQDFCFAKEVKLGTYKGNLLPPGAAIGAQKMAQDTRAEPQYRERVPYVVISGAPGDRLVDRCVSPETLVLNPALKLDAQYYITKNMIPPLERLFNLMGANVRAWFDEMPRPSRIRKSCVACGAIPCECTSPEALYQREMQSHDEERKLIQVIDTCRACMRVQPGVDIECISGDCPVYYKRMKLQLD